MAKKKKKTIPEWAKRKARAGHFTVSGNLAVTCDAAAKKLYLERRRAVRIVAKRLRSLDAMVKDLKKIRPSKMSKSRQELLAVYSYASGVLRELRGHIER